MILIENRSLMMNIVFVVSLLTDCAIPEIDPIPMKYWKIIYQKSLS